MCRLGRHGANTVYGEYGEEARLTPPTNLSMHSLKTSGVTETYKKDQKPCSRSSCFALCQAGGKNCLDLDLALSSDENLHISASVRAV